MASSRTAFALRPLIKTTSKRTNCVVRHDDRRLEPTDLFRCQAEQHEVRVVTVDTAVTVHHLGTWRTSFWEHLGSISCQKKCIKKCRPVNPGHVSQHLRTGRKRSAETPPFRDDTSDKVSKL